MLAVTPVAFEASSALSYFPNNTPSTPYRLTDREFLLGNTNELGSQDTKLN